MGGGVTKHWPGTPFSLPTLFGGFRESTHRPYLYSINIIIVRSQRRKNMSYIVLDKERLVEMLEIQFIKPVAWFFLAKEISWTKSVAYVRWLSVVSVTIRYQMYLYHLAIKSTTTTWHSKIACTIWLSKVHVHLTISKIQLPLQYQQEWSTWLSIVDIPQDCQKCMYYINIKYACTT